MQGHDTSLCGSRSQLTPLTPVEVYILQINDDLEFVLSSTFVSITFLTLMNVVFILCHLFIQ